MAHPIFSSRQLTPNTYVISGSGCDCYLLLGKDEAFMIDSGMSELNIRAYAQSLTELPVSRVINTHSHFDHTAGNGYFDVIYGTAGIARSAKNTMGGNPADYPLDYRFTLVQDGDIIDLKGRPLRVIELDCHAPGNLAVLDETNRMLFPGDELEAGQVLLLPGYAEEMGQIHARHASSVETYLHAMEKLRSFADRFDTICPAHNGTPLYKDYLNRYIELAKQILSGSLTGSPDCSSPSYNARADHYPRPEAGYLRAELDGASLVYHSALLFDRDYANADALPPATNCHLISSATARQ